MLNINRYIDDNIEVQPSFASIKNKVNIDKFVNNNNRHKTLKIVLGSAGGAVLSCGLVVAITIGIALISGGSNAVRPGSENNGSFNELSITTANTASIKKEEHKLTFGNNEYYDNLNPTFGLISSVTSNYLVDSISDGTVYIDEEICGYETKKSNFINMTNNGNAESYNRYVNPFDYDELNDEIIDFNLNKQASKYFADDTVINCYSFKIDKPTNSYGWHYVVNIDADDEAYVFRDDYSNINGYDLINSDEYIFAYKGWGNSFSFYSIGDISLDTHVYNEQNITKDDNEVTDLISYNKSTIALNEFFTNEANNISNYDELNSLQKYNLYVYAFDEGYKNIKYDMGPVISPYFGEKYYLSFPIYKGENNLEFNYYFFTSMNETSTYEADYYFEYKKNNKWISSNDATFNLDLDSLNSETDGTDYFGTESYSITNSNDNGTIILKDNEKITIHSNSNKKETLFDKIRFCL